MFGETSVTRCLGRQIYAASLQLRVDWVPLSRMRNQKVLNPEVFMQRKTIVCAHKFLLIASLALLGAIPVSATFPGKNGRIAFVQAGEIFTMNADGTGIRQLTHLGPHSAASWPAWSADGKQIVFNEFPPPDGIPQLWIMNADGSDQHLIFAEQDFGENRPSFSPDGTKIVFARCQLLVGDGDTCAIYSVGVDGTGLNAITTFQRDTTARSPMYSSDGKTIAFILSNDTAHGFRGVTYLVDADGSNLRRITEPAPCLIRPDWSPDGTKITTFAHFCNPQNETIAVMDADGTHVQYLTDNGKDYFNGPHDRNPAFSPDGKFIVFERNAPDFSNSAIYVMSADGAEMKPVAVLLPSKENPTRAPTRRGQLKKIEEGGAIPRWGVASE
jgi:Tol biopolymer transport system component